ncbi:MAG: polyprenyl synthetase family protein [Spirochaetia bacterium]|nr:polyprenyl synthetase family protein [Spirochaetia bacterium]
MAGLPAPILRIARYFSGGKMIRSRLMREVGDELGAKRRDLILPAAILELVHTTTILHDDVIDLAASRRGETTVHTRFQGQTAVFAADLLFSICMGRLSELGRPGLERDFHEKIQLVCRGEIFQDLHAKMEAPLSTEACLKVAREKTGGLFALSWLTPGYATSQSEETIAWLGKAGFAQGTVFQLMDDVRDLATDSRKEGSTGFRHWTLGSVVWNREDPKSFSDFVNGKMEAPPEPIQKHVRETLTRQSFDLRDEVVKETPAGMEALAGLFSSQIEGLVTAV